MTTNIENPLGLRGIEFVELASPDPDHVHRLLTALGFRRTRTHKERAIDFYEQNAIRILLNRDPKSFGAEFAKTHGPSICSMGWRFDDPVQALLGAHKRGAHYATRGDYKHAHGEPIPALYGIGGSLIYLVEPNTNWDDLGFVKIDDKTKVEPKGFLTIDHLTNNVEKGTLERWASFYKDIFGFTEVRTFDIRGEKTGLYSFALRSPCGTFCIPINQAEEKKSQINEYLERYHGPGIQHLAFLTEDILSTLDHLAGGVDFLDIESGYYDKVFDRVPNVTEDHGRIQKHNVLVDGDDKGYLLQIFTKDLLGPIFLEIIQRKNHLSFGEGNFGALFRSIERDQARRGIFEDAESRA